MAFQTPTINYADFMGLPSFVNLLVTNFISPLQSLDIKLFCSVFMTRLPNWHLNMCYSFMIYFTILLREVSLHQLSKISGLGASMRAKEHFSSRTMSPALKNCVLSGNESLKQHWENRL